MKAAGAFFGLPLSYAHATTWREYRPWAATEVVLFGLALAGIDEQSGYHIADGRADTQRDVKRSDELHCRHGGLGHCLRAT